MDQHLISVDELRAAGALDVPPSWRKSLGTEVDAKQDLLPGFDDEGEFEEEADSNSFDDKQRETSFPNL
jgi:hypothetical protein